MEADSPQQVAIEQGSTFWRRILMGAAALVVVAIGVWQATIIARHGGQVYTAPAAAPVLSGNSFVYSPADIDMSQYYELTNVTLGSNMMLSRDPATGDLVMANSADGSAMKWRFTRSIRNYVGYYSLLSDLTGPNLVVDVRPSQDYALSMSAPSDTITSQYWKITSSDKGCYRFTSQWLGVSWTWDLTSDGTGVRMARISADPTQCWHLTKVGPIN